MQRIQITQALAKLTETKLATLFARLHAGKCEICVHRLPRRVARSGWGRLHFGFLCKCHWFFLPHHLFVWSTSHFLLKLHISALFDILRTGLVRSTTLLSIPPSPHQFALAAFVQHPFGSIRRESISDPLICSETYRQLRASERCCRDARSDRAIKEQPKRRTQKRKQTGEKTITFQVFDKKVVWMLRIDLCARCQNVNEPVCGVPL